MPFAKHFDGVLKYATVEQLRRVLDELQPTDWLIPNSVGNLTIHSPAGEYLGFVDFAEPEPVISRNEPST